MQHPRPPTTKLVSTAQARLASPPRGRILIVDDDRRMASQAAQWLCRQGFHASAAATALEALTLLSRESFDACLVDARLPDDGARRVAARLRMASPRTALVKLVPSGNACSTSSEAASDAEVPWPTDDARMLAAITDARGVAAARADDATARAAIVGCDSSIQRVLDVVRRVAHTRATVLITGETGTGKSHLARTIHEIGRAVGGPQGRFVEVACGAVSESLLESELFGHVAGAFTGAVRDRAGRFLEADGGTIFLDEIATASAAMQVKLLRVLQERSFEPLGGSRTHTVEARVILATHENLEALVADGRFRDDLFWRINVVSIEMPPLRKRSGDIPLLAAHFLDEAVAMAGRRVEGFTDAALAALVAYSWPGNVRQLKHAVERATVLGDGAWIDVDDLPAAVAAAPAEAAAADPTPIPLKHALEDPERRLILDALARHGWCRHAAARELGINRTTLYKKFKRLGIDPATLRR